MLYCKINIKNKFYLFFLTANANAMRYLILLLFLSLSWGSLIAQDTTSKKAKKTKAEKKAEKIVRQLAQYVKVQEMLKGQQFVLEANLIYDRRGLNTPVNPATNFIAVNGDRVVLQVAFEQLVFFRGNGLGGFTLEGRVSDYEINELDKSTILRIQTFGPGLSGTQIWLYVSSNGNTRAEIRNISGRRFGLQGPLKTPEESRVFKGQRFL